MTRRLFLSVVASVATARLGSTAPVPREKKKPRPQYFSDVMHHEEFTWGDRRQRYRRIGARDSQYLYEVNAQRDNGEYCWMGPRVEVNRD